ncbi:serine/threonine protein kinase [Paraburkholderia bannensis]|uniref:serine/threonine protein kinase n=2 Tax=Paraburkholderia bannensis TaxID=765414 RepID=UPI002AB1254D|nr:serine/threonine protein kinase [Paraburkholderia bannensis]
MSDHPIYIVDRDATLEEAPELAARVMQWLEEQGIAAPSADAEVAFSPATHCAGANAKDWVEWLDQFNRCGVIAEIGRQVFHAGGNGVQGLECPQCQTVHDADDVDWGEAVGGWYEEQDDRLACPACEKSSSITDWRFSEMEWGFGNLGFAFDGFGVEQKLGDAISEVLGHRVVIVYRAI